MSIRSANFGCREVASNWDRRSRASAAFFRALRSTGARKLRYLVTAKPMVASNTDADVLILAPIGRDAIACAKLVEQIGLSRDVCHDVSDLIARLEGRVDVVLLTEEAIYGRALESLENWVDAQPPWSDMPFV